MTVASSDSADRFSASSNYGECVDIIAPKYHTYMHALHWQPTLTTNGAEAVWSSDPC